MTPLGKLIAERIHAEGPMPLADYMALCLGHPELGYYMTRDPLGLGGDFITAPEISQVFGELIGAWLAAAWQQQGEKPFHLIELGPGRGTLMKDALRATKRVPGFHANATLHLVETSPVLRAAQALSLPNASPSWHAALDEVPTDRPWFVVANEFFDALPIAQYVNGANRHVAMKGEAFVFTDLPCDSILTPPYPTSGNAFWERSLASEAVLLRLAGHITAAGGAALIIDYAYTQGTSGDTLQAARRHAPCSPLEHQGEADITAHVDFLSLSTLAKRIGCTTQMLSQKAFLERMGIAARGAILLASATPPQAEAIRSGIARLTDADQMGELFKVLAVAPANFTPYPFA